MEDGQTGIEFEADLNKAKSLFEQMGLQLKSIIFPRNQCNPRYYNLMRTNGIIAYRGTETPWCYCSSKREKNFLIKRAFRLLDAYFNVCGNHCYDYQNVEDNGLCNVRSSRFLRPYSCRFHLLEGLRLHRIKKQMTYAARKGKIFHMWWHPHNFGKNIEKNIQNLENLLCHYKQLKDNYGFQTMTICEVVEYCNENRNAWAGM